jgi:ATP synthase I chain
VTSTDALLRRIEITAAAACLLFAVAALVIADGRPGPAISVLAGGALVAVSYYTIKSATDAIVAALAGDGDATRVRRRFAWTVARIALRYALLAFLAYVMISRLRLHPLGLLAGASSVVAAVSVEALRLLVKKQS